MIHWLASYPKSGNTWVRTMLEAYRTGQVNINAMTACISDNQPYFYDAVSPAPKLSREERKLIRPAALLHLTKLGVVEPLVVKTHHANAVIDDIALIPKAVTDSAIYVIRDPRDVVISYAKHYAYSIDEAIDAMADRNRVIGEDETEHVIADWSMHVKSWACEKQFPVLVVKYEQMISDPRRAFGSILAKLGFDVDLSRLDKAIEACRIDKLREQEGAEGFRERKNQDRFFDLGTSGHWRQTLTAEQSARIEETHKEVMDEFSYTAAC